MVLEERGTGDFVTGGSGGKWGSVGCPGWRASYLEPARDSSLASQTPGGKGKAKRERTSESSEVMYFCIFRPSHRVIAWY